MTMRRDSDNPLEDPAAPSGASTSAHEAQRAATAPRPHAHSAPRALRVVGHWISRFLYEDAPGFYHPTIPRDLEEAATTSLPFSARHRHSEDSQQS
jgi:hypothetical protein